jgi:UDP-N-acetylglucosamine 2-epimerase (non-hydrolysing)
MNALKQLKPSLMIVYGTRPEAIKMAPLIRELRRRKYELVLVCTGQHLSMIDHNSEILNVRPTHNLNIFSAGQTLVTIMTKTMDRIQTLIHGNKPDAVIVQGDTSSAFGAALAAFYEQVPVFHVEAGLRSGRLDSPFPEEGNRRGISQIAALHFAPTSISQDNLLREGILESSVAVTGNTVIDALQMALAVPTHFTDARIRDLVNMRKRIVLVTTHRRENWGDGIRSIAVALARIADNFPDVSIVLPLHLNPVVRESIVPLVEKNPNVIVTESLPYDEFVHLVAQATIVLTDSGGLQEEAPSIGKPVLVMRDTTERPEAIMAGTARLVGTTTDHIVDAVQELLTDTAKYAEMANAVNPYGDGRAATRIRAMIDEFFGIGDREKNFNS